MTIRKAAEGSRGGGACVIGGDRRQYYLARELAVNGYSVSVYAVPDLQPTRDISLCQLGGAREKEAENGASFPSVTEKCGPGSVTAHLDLRSALFGCETVILPFPLSPDGITLNCMEEEKPSLQDVFSSISEVCGASVRVYGGAVKERSREIAASFGIEVTDYGAMEEIALENAVPTAEGAVETAMKELNVTIRGSRFTVIGYGRCGSELARLLTAMGAEVCGIARSGKDRAKMRNDGVNALGFDSLVSAVNGSEITFNTVPFNVIDCGTLSLLDKGRVIIELASAPGGVDRECAAKYGVKVIHAPSLPGKYAPKTAAEIIARALIAVM